MKIINKHNDVILKMFQPHKKYDLNNLRLFKYVFVLDIDDGRLLYNSLTKEMILLENDEYPIDYLFEHRFLVNNDFDDMRLCNEVRNIACQLYQTNKLSSYTILTTTDCNARCFYCYEIGCEKINMSLDTAKDVVKYIVSKITDDDKVKLAFFGGEPLFNDVVIDYICKGLDDLGIKYESSMISNGYLFDEDRVNKASTLWNLKKVQITLDGTKDIYNQRKAYIYNTDAFDVVINNIKRLLENKIRVTIRLNLDNSNYDDLNNLVDYLADTFGDNKYLRVYSHVIFQNYLNNNNNEEYINNLYDKQIQLTKHIKEKNLSRSIKLNNKPRINNCMADSGNSVVILPDGKLHNCEHFVDGETWGSIYDDSNRISELKKWRSIRNNKDYCKDCKLYCDCINLVNCPNTNDKCYKGMINERVNSIIESMIKTYEDYKNESKE